MYILENSFNVVGANCSRRKNSIKSRLSKLYSANCNYNYAQTSESDNMLKRNFHYT